ncbi:MAG: 2-hydroxyglutaryl-CoA dehydratase [Deltaproteobacteria bacterium]|nr:2-hydroxyglutaryl-CoA dehydratase [Deltaproteobacteria bacterium]
MITAGCDVGSLTAEAVILRDGKILSARIIPVRPTALESAETVMGEALKLAGLAHGDIALCCATGYGRFSIPFAKINLSEISCHGLGAFFAAPAIRTVIDIGGQDCKVLRVDENGLTQEFAMNDKCAAGTGRSLEILADAVGLDLTDLGRIAQKSKGPFSINNRCSIFMEEEVNFHIYRRKKTPDIAFAINQAVAKRVADLAGKVRLAPGFAITGGVAKNPSVVKQLEAILGIKFTPLSVDPQLVGALGAAVHAMRQL